MSFGLDPFWEDGGQVERIEEELQPYKEEPILQVHWDESFVPWQEVQCIKFKTHRRWNLLERDPSQNDHLLP